MTFSVTPQELGAAKSTAATYTSGIVYEKVKAHVDKELKAAYARIQAGIVPHFGEFRITVPEGVTNSAPSHQEVMKAVVQELCAAGFAATFKHEPSDGHMYPSYNYIGIAV